ncbi:MAG: orotidine-5'-phosphate decarboxylase [Actinomycetota bacterium]
MAASSGALRNPRGVPPADRLIFALDVPNAAAALGLVEQLGDAVRFYKLGLELLMSDPAAYFEVVWTLTMSEKRVFADLKLFDVPETVARAVARAAESGVTFVTVHGNDGMLEAAVNASGTVGILAVTVLTSLDDADLRSLGFACNVHDLVLSRAKRAIEIGCDGVISSGLEVAALRAEVGDGFVAVVPGIRPVANRPVDDQKRTIDVEEAFRAGADYIVVGRPIRDAPDPKAAAMDMQERIAGLFPPG